MQLLFAAVVVVAVRRMNLKARVSWVGLLLLLLGCTPTYVARPVLGALFPSGVTVLDPLTGELLPGIRDEGWSYLGYGEALPLVLFVTATSLCVILGLWLLETGRPSREDAGMESPRSVAA